MTQKMKNSVLRKYYDDVVVLLFVCATFFNQHLQPSLIFLMFVGLFVSKGSFHFNKAKLSWKNPGIWLLIYFVFHVIGTTYSVDQYEAWLDVSMKLAALVFPIYFLIIGDFEVKKFLDYFARIGAVSVLICVLVAFYKYSILGHNPLKEESEFSLFLHRSYQAVYWSIGALWAFYQMIEKRKVWLHLLMGLVLLLGTFLTFSKAGIIALLLSILIMLIIVIVKYKYYKLAFISVIVMMLSLFTINAITPKPLARFEAMISKLMDSEKAESDFNDSSNIRMLVWETSLEIISKNPLLGVGTGDIGDELNIANREKGYTKLAEDNLNSHNQFLNSGVALGIPAVISLIMVFILNFFYGSLQGENKWFVKLVIAVLFIFMMTESALETQAGIVLFSMLFSMFFFANDQKSTRTL